MAGRQRIATFDLQFPAIAPKATLHSFSPTEYLNLQPHCSLPGVQSCGIDTAAENKTGGVLTILVGPARVRQLGFPGITHVPQSQTKAEARVDSKQICEEIRDLKRRLLKPEPARLAGSRAEFREESAGFTPIETTTR
jgi:hypothetical protein